MMTLADALLLAQAHIAWLNREEPPHPNYHYELGKATEYAHCWYFGYLLRPRPDNPPAEVEHFAGAPGFVIVRTSGQLGTISNHQRQELAAQSAIWQAAEQTAGLLLEQPLSLAVLRQHLPLALPELVALKQKLAAAGLADSEKKRALQARLLQAAGFIAVP